MRQVMRVALAPRGTLWLWDMSWTIGFRALCFVHSFHFHRPYAVLWNATPSLPDPPQPVAFLLLSYLRSYRQVFLPLVVIYLPRPAKPGLFTISLGSSIQIFVT